MNGKQKRRTGKHGKNAVSLYRHFHLYAHMLFKCHVAVQYVIRVIILFSLQVSLLGFRHQPGGARQGENCRSRKSVF